MKSLSDVIHANPAWERLMEKAKQSEEALYRQIKLPPEYPEGR